jgi:hypothetical protein
MDSNTPMYEEEIGRESLFSDQHFNLDSIDNEAGVLPIDLDFRSSLRNIYKSWN